MGPEYKKAVQKFYILFGLFICIVTLPLLHSIYYSGVDSLYVYVVIALVCFGGYIIYSMKNDLIYEIGGRVLIDEENKVFSDALKDGTLKEMLIRDPNTDGLLCKNGVCSLAVDDFIGYYNKSFTRP